MEGEFYFGRNGKIDSCDSSVQELYRMLTRLYTEYEGNVSSINAAGGAAHLMSDDFRGVNSSLEKAWKEVSTVCLSLSGEMQKQFEQLFEAMSNFVKETASAEDTATVAANKANEAASELLSLLDSGE